jgi:hypothetical protein
MAKYHVPMPLSPDDFFANALAAADAEGRLAVSSLTESETFPFEGDGLRAVPLREPELPEPARQGEDGSACNSCAAKGRGDVWHDENWRLTGRTAPYGAPLRLLLLPKEHYDLIDLPGHLAAELGRLIVATSRAFESLPHIARAHVSRWGDGGAHLHVFFFARPQGFLQLRGTYLAVWDDLLPPTPQDVRDADALSVARELEANYGGAAITQ